MDLFWKGVLMVEHKSGGKDLDAAYTQALDYFPHLKEEELPRYILVSDFQRFELYDLEAKTEHRFVLAELYGPGTGFVTLGAAFCEERHKLGFMKGVFALPLEKVKQTRTGRACCALSCSNRSDELRTTH